MHSDRSYSRRDNSGREPIASLNVAGFCSSSACERSSAVIAHHNTKRWIDHDPPAVDQHFSDDVLRLPIGLGRQQEQSSGFKPGASRKIQGTRLLRTSANDQQLAIVQSIFRIARRQIVSGLVVSARSGPFLIQARIASIFLFGPLPMRKQRRPRIRASIDAPTTSRAAAYARAHQRSGRAEN